MEQGCRNIEFLFVNEFKARLMVLLSPSWMLMFTVPKQNVPRKLYLFKVVNIKEIYSRGKGDMITLRSLRHPLGTFYT